MTDRKTSRRSPVKEPSLRRPGQSLEEQIFDIQFEKAMIYVLAIGISIALLFYIWFDYLIPTKQTLPLLMTVILVAVFVISIWKLRSFKRSLDSKRLGIDGERVVADILDELKQEGALVFHDLIGDSFNVDHVVISRKGIYVIETKTRSKTSQSKVQYDGIKVLIDGKDPEKNYLNQVAAEAKWVSSELEKGTGKKYPIKPILVFPGWFVKGTGTAMQSDIWVLNPKALVKILQQEPDVLSEEDVKLGSYFLSRLNR